MGNEPSPQKDGGGMIGGRAVTSLCGDSRVEGGMLRKSSE